MKLIFFPGRDFVSLEDLNKQVFEWVNKHDRTPNKKTKLVPLEQFDLECLEMMPVPHHLPRPYRQHKRIVDQYGNIVFDSNSYFAGRGSAREVTVLEYTDSIQIYRSRRLIKSYTLPPFGSRDLMITHDGSKKEPFFRSRTIPPDGKERDLRSMGELVDNYLNNILKKISPVRRNRVIRRIADLRKISVRTFSSKLSKEPLAMKYTTLYGLRM